MPTGIVFVPKAPGTTDRAVIATDPITGSNRKMPEAVDRMPSSGKRSLGAIIGTGTALRSAHCAAHDANRRSSGLPARQVGGSRPVEMIIGIALIVIAALEIWFIVRTVQANMGRA